MNKVAVAIMTSGGILKIASGFLVLGFLIWSMYFTGTYELGFFKGLLAFIALSFFSGITSRIPFGTSFAPILFEWWWHDVPFWEFSSSAWVVTFISMAANILVVIGMLLSREHEN